MNKQYTESKRLVLYQYDNTKALTVGSCVFVCDVCQLARIVRVEDNGALCDKYTVQFENGRRAETYMELLMTVQ